MPGVPATQEAKAWELLEREEEFAVNWDRATAFQPGWQSETLSKKKKDKKKERPEIQNMCVFVTTHVHAYTHER